MKRLFYLGVYLLVLFELANVYFIMPMPYSQAVRVHASVLVLQL